MCLLRLWNNLVTCNTVSMRFTKTCWRILKRRQTFMILKLFTSDAVHKNALREQKQGWDLKNHKFLWITWKWFMASMRNGLNNTINKKFLLLTLTRTSKMMRKSLMSLWINWGSLFTLKPRETRIRKPLNQSIMKQP